MTSKPCRRCMTVQLPVRDMSCVAAWRILSRGRGRLSVLPSEGTLCFAFFFTPRDAASVSEAPPPSFPRSPSTPAVPVFPAALPPYRPLPRPLNSDTLARERVNRPDTVSLGPPSAWGIAHERRPLVLGSRYAGQSTGMRHVFGHVTGDLSI